MRAKELNCFTLSHAYKKEIWYVTVTIKRLKSFIEKKENVFFVVLQVLFFLCYILTNNLHFTVVLECERRGSITT